MKPKKTGYQKTLEFLKKYEGFKDTVYLDGNGIPTIGYGFTDPSLIKKGYISRTDADKRLEQEVRTIEKELRSKVKGWENLADDSKTALLSYRFNYPAGFKDTTRFMLNWNAGDYSAAIREVDAGMNDENNPGLRERRLAEQALLNADPYLQGAKTQVTDNGKKMTFPRGYWDIPQYESTYQLPKQTNTVYPLNPNDRTVPSLDAWNGADSPSAGPNMPSLLKSMDERKRMFDLFGDNAIALGKKKTLPNLRNVLDRKMEDYIAGIMGVPDVYEEPGYTYTPMMYSPMPVFADGKPVGDLSPLFSPRSNPDAKWHQNWLNNRTKQLQDNYSINPDKFDKYGTGTAEGLLKNLKESKEYNSASDVNKEYGYDFGVGAVGHVSSGDIDGVAITGEGNKNNIIMYPSYNVDPKYNPNFINDDTQLVVPMTEEEIKKWNEKIISRTRPLQERLSTYIHERTHALSSPLKNSEIFGTLPQSYKIDLINRKHGLKSTTSHNEREMSPEEYRMVPDEIYAGLNEARYKLNLSPDHVVTKEEVRKWKKEGLLNQYLNDKPDDVLVEYFNEVASNTNPLFDPNNMLKAFGNTDSKIIYAKDGKLPKFEIGKPDDDTIQYTKNGALYNVNKNVVGAKELSVTTPDVNVVGIDQRPMYQRYDAEHSTYDPNAIKNITELAPGIGDVQQGFDAYNAAKNGNYTEAAMLGGLLLLPNVLEKPVVYGKKFLSTALDEFARNKKGYYRIANDFLTDPVRLISDHFDGNYPLTYSLRKDFIKKRNEFFNKQMDIADAYEKVQRDKRLLRHGEDSFFYDDKAVRPNIITARSIKPAWNGVRNFYDPATHSISIPTRTNKYSNFVNFTDPKQLSIFHHEYTHSLQDPRNSKFAPYLSISKYNDNFGYYVPDMKDVKYFTGEYNPYAEAEDWFNVAKYAKQKGDLTFFEKNKHSMDADEWVANARAIKLSPGYTEKDFINYYGDKIRKELLDERSRKMAELIGYKDGKSPIHIKPENRGKLTRLKKRTGKSESELYNDGNPAHKKMVVFARSSRKWNKK